MKINTISAYVLVYLLARGHWNLMVPVRAQEEGDGSSASASGDAGLTAGGEAEGSSLAAPEAPEGSSASPDAGLTGGEGSGHVAGGSVADADQANADSTVELGSLYPDFFTGGMSADEAPITNPVLVAKREDAKRLAEDARKTAQELLKKADELDKAIKDTGVLEDFSAMVDSIAYNLSVEASHLKSAAKPTDMMYYSGFPDGHHGRNQGALDLIREYKNDTAYYTGFPDGNHRYDAGAEDLIERESNWAKSLTYYSGFPNGWHVQADFEVLERIYKEAKRVELKGVIDAKKKEIETFKKVILDLTTQMEKIETDVKNLEEEYNEYVQKMLGLDAALIKLYKADADGNPVLMVENTDFEKKKAHGDIRFEFKAGSLCTLVKYGEHVLWNKGDEGVNDTKLVAFNGSMGLIAVRDNDRAVLYKKETNSDEWKHHNTVERKRPGGTTRTSATPGSSAAPAGSTTAPGSLTSGLSESKTNLDAGSTGTPESVASLEVDGTSSVTSGSSDANEADSGSALRGSTEGSAGEGTAGEGPVNEGKEASAEGKEGSEGEGVAAADYSSVFMD